MAYKGNDGITVPAYGELNAEEEISVGAGGATFTDGTGNVTTRLTVGTGTLPSDCPFVVGDQNVNGSVRPGILLTRDINGASLDNYHGFSDSSTYTLGTGAASNSYDCRPTIDGSNDIDHFACFQGLPVLSCTGTMTDYFGLYLGGAHQAPTGTLTNSYGIYLNGVGTNGTMTNQYGLFVDDLPPASTLNYSIYTYNPTGMANVNVVRLNNRTGVFTDPGANRPFEVLGAPSVGNWRSNIWATSLDYPTIRLLSTNSNKWSGIGTNDDASLHFLVGTTSATSNPIDAGSVDPLGGLVWGSTIPTGGDKGAGTINVQGNIYKNNTAYANPDYVFEKWATGNIVKFIDNEGAKDYKGLAPLSEVEKFAKKNLVLPRLHDVREAAKKNEQAQGSVGLFDGGDAVLASLEEAYLYIFELNKRIEKLEKPGLLRRILKGLKKVVYRK